MKQKLHNPRGIFFPLLIAACLFGGYFAYYSVVSGKILSAIEEQKGKTFNFTKIEKSGFPYRISYRVHELASNNLKIDALRISASPFEPQNWVIDEASSIEFKNQENIYSLIPSNLKSSFNFNAKTRELSHFAVEFDSLKIKLENSILSQLGPTKSQFVREFGAKPKQALNIEIANLETNNSIMGFELDFKNLVLRGPIVFKDNKPTLEIMYGNAELGAGDFTEIKGTIALSRNAKVDGNLNFCFTPSKELAANAQKICGLGAKITNSKIEPDLGSLLR